MPHELCLCDWVWYLWNPNYFIRQPGYPWSLLLHHRLQGPTQEGEALLPTVDVQTPTNKTDAPIKMSLDQVGFCLFTTDTIEMTHFTTFFKKFILALYKNRLNLVFSKFKASMMRGGQNVWIKMSLYYKFKWASMSISWYLLRHNCDRSLEWYWAQQSFRLLLEPSITTGNLKFIWTVMSGLHLRSFLFYLQFKKFFWLIFFNFSTKQLHWLFFFFLALSALNVKFQ